MADDRRVNMDIVAFAEENFDPIDWLNGLKKTEEARANIETTLASTLMKLQLHIQQINASLEKTSNDDVLVNMPKVLRDTQLLKQEALFFKEKMLAVKSQLEDVENSAFSSIHKLEEMDRMKEEMMSRNASLREADNWTALANEVEDVFESGDVAHIAVKLHEMQNSLTKLTNMPDYEDKKLQLEGLKNRLEAVASPKLVQAFTAGSLDQSKLYVDIFGKMDRLSQLLKYYHNCQKISLAQEWRKTIEFAQDENITYWLRTYLDNLLSSWHDQVKWCNQVFSSQSALPTLIDLYADLLLSLDPSLPDCIQSALNRQSSNAIKLSIIQELKQTSRQFATNLQNAIDNLTSKTSSNLPVFTLARAIYVPYVTYVAKYGIYEAAHLNQQLTALGFDNRTEDDLSDVISTLGLSVAKAMGHAEEAHERCKLITEGCAYPGLVKALNTFFNNYQEKFKIGMKQLNKRKVKHEDWNLFQMCLTLMQTTGEFLGQVEQLQNTLTKDIANIYTKLKDPKVSVFNQYDKLLLSETAQKKFYDFAVAVKNDEKSLLDPTLKTIQKLCSDLHRSTYEVIFAPIFTQLMQVRKAPAWSSASSSSSSVTTEANKLPPALSSDLPDYSFAPQEYITQVGQYLMTLPQHLEPFFLRDNPSLTKALKAADPQYSQESCESGFTNILLEIVAKETCQMFQDQSWSIYELSSAACKQLATDIDYLGNILEELGLSLSENLQQMSQLLRLPPDDYQTRSSGCNPRVVAAVRQMRNITLSG